jgi:hypothetical protein
MLSEKNNKRHKSSFAIMHVAMAVLILASCNNDENKIEDNVNEPVLPAPQNLTYTVIKAYPHDTAAFTQGLEWHGGTLLESTGLYGKSMLRQLDLTNGKSSKQIKNDKEIFAEGITVLRDTVYQLTIWFFFMMQKVSSCLVQKTGAIRAGGLPTMETHLSSVMAVTNCILSSPIPCK